MLPSQSIDHRIPKYSEHSKRTSKILLLGAGESGKTTVMKQARILYGNCYSAENWNITAMSYIRTYSSAPK
jgi:hypothetical protein